MFEIGHPAWTQCKKEPSKACLKVVRMLYVLEHENAYVREGTTKTTANVT